MPPDRDSRHQPVPPFHVRQLTIEDGLTLAASPQPGAWQVYDALHDADLTKSLLTGIADDAEIGSLRMRTIPGASFSANA